MRITRRHARPGSVLPHPTKRESAASRGPRCREKSPTFAKRPHVTLCLRQTKPPHSRSLRALEWGTLVKIFELNGGLPGPPAEIDLTDINWVIVGGESGPGARPMLRDWVVSIRRQCRQYGVPFFFKQWGGVRKQKAGRLLDGRTYDEMPVVGSPETLDKLVATS